MLGLLLLTGCSGVLRSSEGREPIRGAIWFEDVSLSVAGGVPNQDVVLLTNSPMSCWPEVTEDDPSTDEDEAASASVYWSGEVTAAFTREDARVVFLALYRRTGTVDGAYTLLEEARPDPGSALGQYERTGWGGWLHVVESRVDDLDGLFYDYQPVEVVYNLAVQAPAEAEVARRDDAIDGTFAFHNDHLSGSFTAESCDNDVLFNQIVQAVSSFGSLTSVD
jgi:hypothetical protein